MFTQIVVAPPWRFFCIFRSTKDPQNSILFSISNIEISISLENSKRIRFKKKLLKRPSIHLIQFRTRNSLAVESMLLLKCYLLFGVVLTMRAKSYWGTTLILTLRTLFTQNIGNELDRTQYDIVKTNWTRKESSAMTKI